MPNRIAIAGGAKNRPASGWSGALDQTQAEYIFFGREASMALSIKDPETERLARELARRTGESITEATRTALHDRLRRLGGARQRKNLLEDLAAIRRRCAALPVFDACAPDDIIGYDAHGLPR